MQFKVKYLVQSVEIGHTYVKRRTHVCFKMQIQVKHIFIMQIKANMLSNKKQGQYTLK